MWWTAGGSDRDGSPRWKLEEPQMRGYCVIGTITLLGLVVGLGCGGGSSKKDPLGKESIIIDGQQGQGVVKRYSAISKPSDEVAEGHGEVIFEVQHVDRLVNQEVTIELVSPDDPGNVAGMVKGNETLSIGLADDQWEASYDARLVYKHSEAAKYEDSMTGITVHRGRKVKYKVKLEAPVGFLDLRFRNDGVGIDSKVRIDVHPAPAEEGGEPGEPVVTDFEPSEMLAVPAGTYNIRAQYNETATLFREVWLEGLVVGGGMARLIHEHDFAVRLHGFLLNAKNFGEDVNDKTTVYFYRPGANVEFAVAVDQGPAGEVISTEPGIYDVRVVYQPSPEPTTWGDLVLPDVEIGGAATEQPTGAAEGDEAADGDAGEPPAEGDGAEGATEGATEGAEGDGAEGAAEDEEGEPEPTLVEMEVDLEKPLGTLIVKAMWADEDVSDKAMLRAIFSGADKQAASAVLNVTGLRSHVIPAGDYDILITYDEVDRRGQMWFDALHFEHGDTWEKTVQLRN